LEGLLQSCCADILLADLRVIAEINRSKVSCRKILRNCCAGRKMAAAGLRQVLSVYFANQFASCFIS